MPTRIGALGANVTEHLGPGNRLQIVSEGMRSGPLFEPRWGRDAKDPCPVFDGAVWHLFGSTGSVVVERWRILHATAPLLSGPWMEQEPAFLQSLSSDRIAAPGVVWDSGLFHMFVQTDFIGTGGS